MRHLAYVSPPKKLELKYPNCMKSNTMIDYMIDDLCDVTLKRQCKFDTELVFGLK